MYNQIYRGQIYYADLEPSFGSEQGGIHLLIIQNDMGNKYSPTTIIVAITARIHSKQNLPTHHRITASVGLKSDSIVLLEQIRTIDKARLRDYVGSISHYDMKQIESKLIISLGINKYNL
ncbi:MAG: type II toxin-antitoxin system PemK/MazF family toxin [Thomasclavelia ramosa]